MAPALTLAAVTFLLAVPWGAPLIRTLRGRGIGEQIRIEGPASHRVKTGTPTMGGILIIVPVAVVTVALLVWDRYLLDLWGPSLSPDLFRTLSNLVGDSIVLPLGVMLATGVLGGLDDLRGVGQAKRRLETAEGEPSLEPLGILARYKLAWLIAIATVAALALHLVLGLRSLALPTVPQRFDIIGIAYLAVAVFIIVGSANAVNLTDGLDGLAGGAAVIAFAGYGVIALLQAQIFLLMFCFTVVGAVLAFLWYNAYPAQLFMGDVGSLALGATLAVVALMTGQWLLLPLVGFVFVAETLSVILQVAYFRISGGRRVLRMSPIHHHFELGGWSEVQVVQRFWLVAMLAAMLGIALALL